jgi:sugar phosphate isomerase/epimerase
MRDVARIRVGGQTSFAAATIAAPFEYAVAHGFDAFEWFPDRRPTGQGWLDSDLPPEARALIRRTAREHDIALSVHGSWDANLLSEEGRRCLARQARFAADLGAVTFVIHLDGGTDLVPYVEAMTSLAAQLTADGIQLAVENTPTTAPGEVNELFHPIGACSSEGPGAVGEATAPTGTSGPAVANGGTRSAPAVGMCLDVGHANLYAGTRNDYLAYVDSLSADVVISHVHLHENWGDADSHLPLFTGPAARDASGIMGLVDRLVQRRFAGCIVLEQWPDPPALLDMARTRLGDLFSARLHGAARASAPSR